VLACDVENGRDLVSISAQNHFKNDVFQSCRLSSIRLLLLKRLDNYIFCVQFMDVILHTIEMHVRSISIQYIFLFCFIHIKSFLTTCFCFVGKLLKFRFFQMLIGETC